MSIWGWLRSSSRICANRSWVGLRRLARQHAVDGLDHQEQPAADQHLVQHDLASRRAATRVVEMVDGRIRSDHVVSGTPPRARD